MSENSNSLVPEQNTKSSAGCLFLLMPILLFFVLGPVSNQNPAMVGAAIAICAYQAVVGYLQISRLDRIERLLRQPQPPPVSNHQR